MNRQIDGVIPMQGGAVLFAACLLAACAGKGPSPKSDRPHYDRETGTYAAKPPAQSSGKKPVADKPIKPQSPATVSKTIPKTIPKTATKIEPAEIDAARIGPQPEEGAGAITQVGVISFYGRKFHGRRTASGENFNMHAMTAAHPTLPFGTRVKVTNLTNGKTVTVRINDRGPFIGRRILDVSRAAAEALGMVNAGTVRARVQVL